MTGDPYAVLFTMPGVVVFAAVGACAVVGSLGAFIEYLMDRAWGTREEMIRKHEHDER